MDWERFDVDVFLDWGNWNFGFMVEWNGIPEGMARYRICVLSFGPLVCLATYRL